MHNLSKLVLSILSTLAISSVFAQCPIGSPCAQRGSSGTNYYDGSYGGGYSPSYGGSYYGSGYYDNSYSSYPSPQSYPQYSNYRYEYSQPQYGQSKGGNYSSGSSQVYYDRPGRSGQGSSYNQGYYSDQNQGYMMQNQGYRTQDGYTRQQGWSGQDNAPSTYSDTNMSDTSRDGSTTNRPNR